MWYTNLGGTRMTESSHGEITPGMPSSERIESYLAQINEAHRQIHSQLNEIFAPLCNKLLESIANVSKEELENLLEKLPETLEAPFDAVLSATEEDLAGYLPLEISKLPRSSRGARLQELASLLNSMPDHSRPTLNEFGQGQEQHSAFRAYMQTLSPGNQLLFADFVDIVKNESNEFEKFKELTVPAPTRFLWMPTGTMSGNHSVATRYVSAFVTNYGEEFARQQLRSTTVLMRLSEANQLVEFAQEIAESKRRFLERNTARAREVSRDESLEVPPTLLTLQEGIVSLNQSISLFLAEGIPEIEDANQAINLITQHHLPAKLAVLLPAGVVGPAILKGRMIPHLLEWRNGKLMISREARKKLLDPEIRDRTEQILKDCVAPPAHQHWKEGKLEISKHVLRSGCPVSHGNQNYEQSGVSDVAVVFSNILHRIS